MSDGVALRLDASNLQAVFKRLSSVTQNMQPVMQDIGLMLAENTQERFRANVGPDGQAWQSSERAQRDGGRTLLDHGHLRDSITYIASADRVEVGTNMVYAAIHQFGGKTKPHKITPKRGKALKFNGRFAKSVDHPGSRMPPRPFLGLSAEDEREATGIIEDHIRAAL